MQRQNPFQQLAAIHHEDLIGVIRQFLQAAQIAQHHFQRHIVANGHEVEIHQRADRILRVGHGGAQLLAFFDRQRLEDVVHDVVGQIGGQVGELIGIERLGGRDQLGRFHLRDERLAHRFRQLEQHLAFAVGLDQVPHHHALIARQGLEDVGHVGGVQGIELSLQLGRVPLLHDRFHQRVAWHLLLVHEILHQALLLQQSDDLLEMLLDTLLSAGFLDFGHVWGGARDQAGEGENASLTATPASALSAAAVSCTTCRAQSPLAQLLSAVPLTRP